ncbi:MAG: chorismate synthase, partial [Gemmatimonadota bacterium]
MQIERDRGEFLSGVRAGETLRSPIAILERNDDWAHWEALMDPAPRADDTTSGGRARQVTRVRPGHA